MNAYRGTRLKKHHRTYQQKWNKKEKEKEKKKEKKKKKRKKTKKKTHTHTHTHKQSEVGSAGKDVTESRNNT